MLRLARSCWPKRAATRTEHHLRALGTRLRREGAVGGSQTIHAILSAERSWLWHRLHCCSHRSGDSDRIRVVTRSAFDPVSRRQERVKSLDELWITRKERTDSTDDAWGVDGSRLEVFHDVQETVVDVWMVGELDLDLVEVAQRVVQDRLLTLALHLLLGALWLRSWRKGYEEVCLHWLRLGLRSWLYWTTGEDVARSRWSTQG